MYLKQPVLLAKDFFIKFPWGGVGSGWVGGGGGGGGGGGEVKSYRGLNLQCGNFYCVGGSKELAVLYESYSTATFVIQHGFVLYR